MKLLTFSAGGAARLGVLTGERVVDLSAADPALPADMESLLRLGDAGLDAARKAVARASAGAARPLSAVRVLKPIARPEKIIGIGLNYRDHCIEANRPIPTVIRSFAMFANALVGPEEPVIMPRTSTQIDWEAELVAVIGKPAKHVKAARALDHVAGYTCGNDVSARDHQAADPQTTRGKSADTHAPIGPWIVTRDEIPDPGTLKIALTLNGVTKQDSNTSELVFPVPELIEFLSFYFTLNPGDLIFTGTPAGVGFTRNPPEWLKAGDRVEVTVERIGTLGNPCVAEASGQ